LPSLADSQVLTVSNNLYHKIYYDREIVYRISSCFYSRVGNPDNPGPERCDYEKKLVWNTLEGFSVRPYYRTEDLKDLHYLNTLPGEFPYLRGTKTVNDG
jgi:hypothetical protein